MRGEESDEIFDKHVVMCNSLLFGSLFRWCNRYSARDHPGSVGGAGLDVKKPRSSCKRWLMTRAKQQHAICAR